MIDHLQEVHKVNREGAIPMEQGQVLIESAFGKTRPQIVFKGDLFRDLLLRWMILNHISFSQVEQSSFRVLLRYLVACVSSTIRRVTNCIKRVVSETYHLLIKMKSRMPPTLKCHMLFQAQGQQ